MLRRSSCNVPRYIWVNDLSLTDVAASLEMLLYHCPNTNFSFNATSTFKVLSARQVFCSIIQVARPSEKNQALVGFPERTVASNGCSHWRFYEEVALKRLYPHKIPWFFVVPIAHPSQKNAVIRTACLENGNVNNSFILLSRLGNFTITDCYDTLLSCEFFEIVSKRDAIHFVPNSVDLYTFEHVQIGEHGFHSFERCLVSQMGISCTPLHNWRVDRIFGHFRRTAQLRCSHQVAQVGFRNERMPLQMVVEFLICSFFAPVPIPCRGTITATLLVIWTLLMQIPASGFRAMLTSCLNEPPRRDPISGLTELSGKLSVSADTLRFYVQAISTN